MPPLQQQQYNLEAAIIAFNSLTIVTSPKFKTEDTGKFKLDIKVDGADWWRMEQSVYLNIGFKLNILLYSFTTITDLKKLRYW